MKQRLRGRRTMRVTHDFYLSVHSQKVLNVQPKDVVGTTSTTSNDMVEVREGAAGNKQSDF